MIGAFRPVTIDDSPQLLETSHRLRYQAYCVERRFLRAEDYPNQLEFDDFDGDSVHVGVLGAEGQLAGTARIVKPNSAGLPAFRHCSLFSADTTLADEGNRVVEISRVCINRRYTRRRAEGICEGSQAVESGDYERRKCGRRDDVFATLVKAVYHATKRLGATHWLIAIEKPLRRRLARYGLPFELAGPEVDYYGRVAPYIMNLVELDRVIIGRQFAALDDFALGLPPGLWPELDEHNSRLYARRAGASPVHPLNTSVAA
jgi:N-acyl amino acid synthase of PEP-CTERM/exosortase system